MLIAESLRRKVNFWIEDTVLKDKIDHINVNIEEGEDNPELQMIEEMLRVHVKQKEFDTENFSSEASVKLFCR